MNNKTQLLAYKNEFGLNTSWEDLMEKFQYDNIDELKDHWYEEEGMVLKKKWVTPEGKIGRSYHIPSLYGITEKTFKNVTQQLKNYKWKSTKNKKSKAQVGVVAVSDIHSGALVDVTRSISLKDAFDPFILNTHLNKIAQDINEKEYSEVHLLMPGDLIESFSARNHADTWKNISHYQGDIIIFTYELLSKFFASIDNLTNVYMVEGNHDRFTEKKEGNNKRGVVEVLCHFLQKIQILNFSTILL
jgi:hypothetical protein